MEELYKKGLNDLENHYGVVIYLVETKLVEVLEFQLVYFKS